jgi:hypothetical protein
MPGGMDEPPGWGIDENRVVIDSEKRNGESLSEKDP